MLFLNDLYSRSAALYYFGLVCFIISFICWVASVKTKMIVAGANAFHKPIKFAISIGIYAWTMAWYVSYLNSQTTTLLTEWTIIILLGFEIVYIAIQAMRGQRSHFNNSTPLYSFLYNIMALAATVISFLTLYIGFLFLQKDVAHLPAHYRISIFLSCIVFFIFSLEGYVMGARLSHTIGAPDFINDTKEEREHRIPFLNWSTKFGDPRIAHFVGMHALQVMPFLSFYFIKSVFGVYVLAFLYVCLASWLLAKALAGQPVIKTLTKK